MGENEPMASVINKYGNGIVLNRDGSDVKEILSAILRMKDEYPILSKKAESAKFNFCWSAQNAVFKMIFDSIG